MLFNTTVGEKAKKGKERRKLLVQGSNLWVKDG